MKTKFERKIEFTPGYDHIVIPDKKYGPKYGRHGMNMRFLLKSRKATVQVLIYTGWLPMIDVGGGWWKPTYDGPMAPIAADIGYHAVKKQYKGQEKRECEYLDSGSCYYDGSSLYAMEFMATFFNEGEEALWKKMEGYYKDIK